MKLLAAIEDPPLVISDKDDTGYWRAYSRRMEPPLVNTMQAFGDWRFHPGLGQMVAKVEDEAIALVDAVQSGRFAEHYANEIAKLSDSERLSSSAGVDQIDTPCPEGLSYLPYQRAAILYARERTGVLIADEMGLGKTVEAIGIINDNPEAKSVLVICPATLKGNWAKECKRWLCDPVLSKRISIIDPRLRRMPRVIEGSQFTNGVFIINYDLLMKHRIWLRQMSWDIVVMDECHMIKNPGTTRTKAALGGKCPKSKERMSPIRAKKRIAMSGTPVVNHAKDLFPVAHWLNPSTFSSLTRFVERFGSGKRGQNLEELQALLRQTIMVRRSKAAVSGDLPPKTRQIIELPPTKEMSRALAIEFKEVIDTMQGIQQVRAIIDAGGVQSEDYQAAVERMKGCRQSLFGNIMKMRQMVALAKLPLCLDHIDSQVVDGQKVVIFAHHKAVVAKIMEHYGNERAVFIDGSVNGTERTDIVDRFQAPGGPQFFVGTIKAAGVGLTLTAASTGFIIELPWTAADLLQAEDRLHRKTQDNPVLIQHLVLEGSLDSLLCSILISKLEMMDQVTNEDRLLQEDVSTEDILAEAVGAMGKSPLG